MREMHAVANGDGTYTVTVVAQFKEGLRQFVHPHAYIKYDELVLDELPSRQTFHFQVGNQEIPPEVFQQFVNMHP